MGDTEEVSFYATRSSATYNDAGADRDRITYADPNGTQRTWESGERLTRVTGSDIDGVGVVAVLRDPKNPDESPRIVLQKQWRPPINATCIEVPAGLMDPKESPETCAIRELKEETGYVGELMGKGFNISPVMFNGEYEFFCGVYSFINLCTLLILPSISVLPLKSLDPGFCNTNLRMIHLTVDLSNPLNQNPQPELEDNEFIETFTVALTDLWDECIKLENEGYAIDARVGTLAEGVELAKRWKL